MTAHQLPSWMDLVKVNDIVPERPIIFLPAGTTVEEALNKLHEKKILSAPVVDVEHQKFVGFVDMIDILTGMLANFPGVQEDDDIDYKYLQALEEAGRNFSSTPVEQVISLARKYHQDESNFVTIDYSAPIRDLIKHFYEGLHRVAIADKRFNVINVISQSDVVAFLARNPHLLGSKVDKTVSELGIGSQYLVTVRPEKKTIAVLQTLVLNKISAVPVVDKSGQVIANFSVSNLRGLQKDQFPDLLLPVVDFLRKQVLKDKPFCNLSDTLSQQCLIPITCKHSSTLEYLLLKLVATRTHRLWVVDDRHHPVAVVSLTDLMKALLSP